MSLKEEEPLRVVKDRRKKKNLREKIAYIKENITLEPVLISYVVPGVLARLATQNLNLDKACRVNLGYGDAVCNALIAKEGTKYQREELIVQQLIASMEAWKNIILTAIPSLLILFIGAWSDRTGKRKICIILPIIGDLLMCLSNILNAYYFYEIPVQITMFFEALFPAITGGWITTYMGTFSYIGEISSKETRTFRVGIANLCLTAGSPIGTALSGILLKHIGYYGVFSLSSLLFCFSIFYGYIYIKDPERPNLDKKEAKMGTVASVKSFFNIQHVKDTLSVAFQKGPNNRRLKSILVLFAIAFIYGPAHGEYTMRYLFTRYRFNWDALKYSFYNTFYICIHSFVLCLTVCYCGVMQQILRLCLFCKKGYLRHLRSWSSSLPTGCFSKGALISISLFSRRLKWQDATLGIISNVSKIIGGLATGLARNSLEMYLAVAIEMFNATSFTALRSISSKLATSDELGKMTSVFNLTEILTSMVFGPIYSWIYMMTLKIDAGVIYYCSTVLTIPPILIFTWFYLQDKKDSNREVNDVNNEGGATEQENKRKPDTLVNSIDLNGGLCFVE